MRTALVLVLGFSAACSEDTEPLDAGADMSVDDAALDTARSDTSDDTSCEAAAEDCNGVDDDCDGLVDEDIAAQPCGSDIGSCERGSQVCIEGAWGACEGGVMPTPELDDGLDNDCDGVIENGIPCESDLERQQREITNAERAGRGLSVLVCDHGLRRAARKHAEDMCARNYFSHTTQGSGEGARERITRERVAWTKFGENLAWGPDFASPMQVHVAWMGSDSHRPNILDADFGRLGVGRAVCAPMRDPYWVQNFAD